MVGKHIFENVVQEEQSMPRHCYLSKRDFDEHCSSNCPGCRSILKGIRRQGHREACRQRLQKALEGTDRLERAKAREHEFYEEVLRREDKKRALDDGGPEGVDERISLCDHSREIGGLARIPSQASRSSRLNDEDKKLGMKCVKSRTAGSGVEKGISSARGEAEKTRDHGGIIRGEQVDDDTDEVDGFDDFQERVCDDRTGEVLDAKDECWARTGGAPMSTKWVRVNQGTSSNPIVRPGLSRGISKRKERNLCLQPCRHWRPRHCCSACAPRSRSFIAKANGKGGS